MSDFKHKMSRLCHNDSRGNDTLKFSLKHLEYKKRFHLLRFKEKGIVKYELNYWYKKG